MGEEEEGRRLFLVTVVVHILLPGIIILKTFPRIDRPYKKINKKKKENKKKTYLGALCWHNRICLKHLGQRKVRPERGVWVCQPTQSFQVRQEGGERLGVGLYQRDFWKTKRILRTRLLFMPRRVQGTRFSPFRRGGRRQVEAAMGTPRENSAEAAVPKRPRLRNP